MQTTLTSTASYSPVAAPPFTPRQQKTSDSPSVVDVAEHGQVFVDMAVVGLTMFPGFLLTTPGLILFILPVIAIGLLVATAGGGIAVVALTLFVAFRVTRRAARAVARLVPHSLPRRSAEMPATGIAMPTAS